MARDNTKFSLQEGVLNYGDMVNPQLIGTNATSPASFFTKTAEIGVFKQGTISVELPREYAEAWSGTPATLERKDLIKKSFMMSGELYQFDGSSIALLKNTQYQNNYTVTIPTGEHWDLNHLGANEPTQSSLAWQLDAKLTDGTRLLIYVYYGQILTEDNTWALSGTEHAVQPFQISAFPHPDFVATDKDEKFYGLIANQID